MIDGNIKLAKTLVEYSCKIKKNEKVLISYEGNEAKGLVKEIIKNVYRKNAIPFVEIRDSEMKRELLLKGKNEQFILENKFALTQMKDMDAYIAIRGGANSAELSDVPEKIMNEYQRALRETLDYRVNKTKWVILRYPVPSFAQSAGMSLDSFSKFYFDVCNLDYKKMKNAMTPLKNLMEKTNEV
ncbi:MAG: aminopeptidase, partial [Clostridiales Family XIII bacterium]|nr:aminopeptidase [Clostridiales Family XIII bacterium]